MGNSKYDLVVVGSGPAGQKAAIQAAKLRKHVAIIDRKPMIGGVCVHTGTIPSKTLREAILYLTGFTERTFYGSDYVVKEHIEVQDLAFRVKEIVDKETEVIRTHFRNNGITLLCGSATFVDPHTLQVMNGDDSSDVVHGDNFLIACGTRPAHSPDIPIDGERIIDTDQFSRMKRIPRDMIVVGAGVVGLEYSSFFSALGVNVTVIEQRPTILDFVDHEIVEALTYYLRRMGATLRFGETVSKVGIDQEKDKVFAELASGKRVLAEGLLYAVGRQANADLLNIEAAGLKPDSRGRLQVNLKTFQTEVAHIYAAGDVIGFPALASTSMEQGRLAACSIFGSSACGKMADSFPFGIYTIPEISTCGPTEEQLTAKSIPYEVGIARYSEVAKAMMLGDDAGMLKLLFDPKTLKLLAVHAIGDRATEIVHIGQAVMWYGGTIDFFRDAVFNYPTLAEAYKIAAFNGMNKL